MNPNLLKLITKLERIAKKSKYGTISGNVVLTNGQPNLQTFHVVVSRRLRFPLNNGQKVDKDE